MCLTLWPLKECGWGTCVNGSCICQPGYQQNLEFFFREVEPSVVTLCDYNQSWIEIIASTLLCMSILNFLFHLSALRNKRQVKRAIPVLGAFILVILTVTLRLIYVDENLFGHDIPYTLLYSYSVFLFVTGQILYYSKLMKSEIRHYIYEDKYTSYLMKRFYLKASTVKYANFTKKAKIPMIILAFIANTLWVLPSFGVSNKIGLLSARIASAFYLMISLFLFLDGTVLFTLYSRDLCLLLNSPLKQQMDKEFIIKCRRTLPRIKLAREISGLCNAASVFIQFLAILYEGWLKLWVYTLYCLFFLTNLVTFLLVFSSVRRRKYELQYKPSSITPEKLELNTSAELSGSVTEQL